IQIITNDVYPRAVEKIDDAVYYDAGERMLYQPWATDLLPAEIDFNWINLPREREINWCGSIWDRDMGNREQIEEFKRSCAQHNITFNHISMKSNEENRRYIQRSYIAPHIVTK